MHTKRYDSGHLNLLRELITTQFKMKEQGSLLGVLWSALNPLLMLSILYVVFNFHMGAEIDNFAVYLLIGLVIYTHFANSTAASMRVFYNMRAVTANAVFPKEILVVAAVLSRSLELAISFVICIAIAWFTGVTITSSVSLLLAVIVIQTGFALSVSLILSFLYLYLKDIDHLYQLVLRILFFLTPIFYELDYLGDSAIRTVVLMNPLTQFAMIARSAIFGVGTSWEPLLVSAVFSLALLVMSLAVFRWFEPALAERV